MADAALAWEPQTGLPAALLESEPAEPAEPEPGLAKQVGAWHASDRKTLLARGLRIANSGWCRSWLPRVALGGLSRRSARRRQTRLAGAP